MLKSFGDRATEDFFNGLNTKRTRKLPKDIAKTAYRKLDMVNSASKLDDLRVPPGNRLEKLSGNLDGLWSIRINDQWRLVFTWESSDAYKVVIADYH